MKNIIQLTLLFAILLAAGCQSGTHLSGLVPGKGTVTLDGAAVEDASLMFIPITQTTVTRPGNAISLADGSFELATLQPKDGIFPGEYKVIVWKTLVETTERANESSLIKETDLLPAVYKTAATTPLRVTIGAKGETEIRIELEK